jgi:hypothetical protein
VASSGAPETNDTIGAGSGVEPAPTSSRDPDLRHVRYVALSPSPPDRAPSDIPFVTTFGRSVLLGAFAGGSLALQVTGRAIAGLTLGSALGAASAVWRRYRHGGGHGRSFALVPWGLLVDGERDLMAVRWSGVHSLDVKYRASRDGSVHARVAVDSVAGEMVGFSSDAVDLGALADDLSAVALASSRPLAVDLAGRRRAPEGEPFVDRVLDAARTLVSSKGDQLLGLEPLSYRAGQGVSRNDVRRVAGRLHELGVNATGDADPWGLVAAVAGELRLRSFARELGRLGNAPNPGVAAIARAALGRMSIDRGPSADEVAADTDVVPDEVDDALRWFVQPDELARLRAWRDAK